MEKEFVPYEQALTLKELGFDEPCLAFYLNTGKFYTTAEYPHSIEYHKQNQLGDYNYDSTSAPTFSQVFRWFREKYCLNSFIVDSKSYAWYFNINDMQTDDVISEVLYFKKYEEAELECLKKLIEITKVK